MPLRHNTVAPEEVPSANIREEQGRILSALSDDEDYLDAPRIQRDAIDETNFRDYAIHRLGIDDAYIEEHEILYPPSKTASVIKNSAEIPRWVLLLLSNVVIIILIVTFCVFFVFQQVKVGYGESCLTNSHCNSQLNLKCTAGTCSCSTVQFWDGYRCISQRTYNRSCLSQSQCNSLSKLLCMNVTIGSYIDSVCWCSSYRYWTGDQCANLKSFNETCSSNGECDINNFLTCISGRCDCNSTQFWNNEYCENKRIYGEQCFSTYWCNNATSGLQCSTTEPTTGTCDCLSNQYWWSANRTCLPQLPINSNCSFDYQCLTNLSLSCSSNTNPPTCQCSDSYWYNLTKCTPQFLSGSFCNNSLQCDSTRFLTCNTTAQRCTCNETEYIWDGSECVIRRTIGGACLTDDQCLARQNLICGTSGVWNSTCACPTNYYWNTTSSLCVIKKLWNSTCSTSYECYDGGYLSCQPNAGLNATICDCGNYTYYWTGFINNTYSGYCTPKVDFGVSFNCTSNYQCRDYNYVTCISGQCDCTIYQYWDGTLCEPRLNYSYPCNSTSMCRNWPSGPNLQCLTPLSGGSIKQCLCNTSQYFDYCADSCYTAKDWQQACNTSTCFATSSNCDQSKSLTCINNICNCTNTEWWNATSCVGKGTYLSACTTGLNYQCQEYNFLTCISSQCQCGSTMYWNSTANYCLSKKSINGTCSSTSECLTAAGVGLTCTSGQCVCASGYTWNSIAQQCDPIG